MKWVKTLIIVIWAIFIVLALIFGGRMFFLGKKSQEVPRAKLGVEKNHLKACGKKPNCVSTQASKDSSFYIEPIRAINKEHNIKSIWADLLILLPKIGLKEVTSEATYLHFTQSSQIFSFIDDVEFLLNEEEQLIEMRSRSRVGYSDMGVNRKRLEYIKSSLEQKL